MARFQRKREGVGRRFGRWSVAVLASAAGHGLLALFLFLTGYFDVFSQLKAPAQAPVNPIALRALPSSSWEQNRAVGPRPKVRPPDSKQPLARAEPPKVEEPKKKEPEPIPKGKVVDVAPGNGQKPDDDAQFLAESNNRVEKETRSRDATPFYKNAMPRPSSPVKPSDGSGRDFTDKPSVAGNGGKGADDKPASEGQKKQIVEIPRIEKKEELALRFDGLGSGHLKNQPGSDALEGNSDRYRVQPGGPEGDEGSTGRAGDKELTLSPSATVLDRIAGAPASDLTPLDDVEIGEGTYLNTREWKHSSFFNRVKQYVGMHWNPNTLVRTKDPTGEIFLYKDRHTVVAVTLDERGLLKNINVEKSCGVDFLDREAIAAFQRAQPFPNPPPALTNDRGEIRFTFGFYLEVGRGGLDLFRPGR